MLISPSEPIRLKRLGTVSSLPEKYGCDILIVSNGVRTGVQRKEFPGDYASSLADGRLFTQVRKMAELERAILIFEGEIRWQQSGILDWEYGARITRELFYGAMFELIWEWGIEVYHVPDLGETMELCKKLEEWSGRAEHKVFRTRPALSGDAWGVVEARDRAVGFYQLFPGIGADLAGRIYDTIGLNMELNVTAEDLMKVKGIGKKKAEEMMRVLEKWTKGQ